MTLSQVRLIFAALLLSPLAPAQVTRLSFRPIDAAYDSSLDRIILVSANPNQLHIYNAATNVDQTVSLAEAPLNLALSSDGTHAAVAFTDAVAYVDLQGGVVSKTLSNGSVGSARVILGVGYIYEFPTSSVNPVAINVSSGQITKSALIYYNSAAVFDGALDAIYGVNSNSLSRYDTSGEVLGNTTSQPSNYFGMFRICGPLWLSHDGSTIYSACGTVFQASNDSNKDLRYLGVLPGIGNIQSLATSSALNQIAAIPQLQTFGTTSTPPVDTFVDLYDSRSLNAVGQFATTPFVVNSASFPAHGRWIFYNSSSSAAFVITQADSSAALEQDYAIENVNLTSSNSCTATFAATSASVRAAGSYQTIQINSGEDCTFTAVSGVPWVTLSSGYYGSGTTTLTYLVRPNPTASPRSGTITLGSQSFTVNQDAAAAASALNPLSFKAVAADYDKGLDKIIMVSSSPNELHIYDPVSASDQIVSLSYIPLSVSVRPDGLFAAVGHSGHISLVDLQALTVTNTIPVDMDNAGIALAATGYAYTFPSQTASFGGVNSIQLSTGTLTPLQDGYYGNFPRLYASGNYLYVGSYEGVSKLNISSGPATLVTNAFGLVYGNIWLSEDGNRLLSSNGNAFFTSVVASQDFMPDGGLSTTNSVIWAANSQI